MINGAISKLVEGQDLTRAEMISVMDEIMGGEADNIQTASFLTALEIKGATTEEITAGALSMRNHADTIETYADITEIVGTGGDKSNSFNISTTSAFVAAAAGVKVAKHGNRAASSKSGAADVLEKLGLNITLDKDKSLEMLEKYNFCFLFAVKYHSAMKFVAPVRKMLGIRTIFNILGPLTNPAKASTQVLGVYDKALVKPMSRVLSNLGVKRGMTVYGMDGLDEISASDSTYVCELREGWFREYEIQPEDFGYKRCDKAELIGGTPEENAEITRNILNGKLRDGKRNAVCLNAGAAIYVSGRAESLESGIKTAEKIIDDGRAIEKMNEIITFSKQFA
ncbi:MAG: anthranilate phosphoribosyltransferase [Lachnospiraceae bacterium]|nr:anthranilate phosphoribosyltransferase [Lachnospiraceae bacterium]